MRKLTFDNFFKKGMGFFINRQMLTQTVSLHNHDFFEIELAVSAKNATHVLNGHAYPLEKGSVYFLNPSDIHSIEIGEGGHFDRYNVLFRQDIVSQGVLSSVIHSNCAGRLTGEKFDTLLKLYDALSFYYQNAEQNADEIGSRFIEIMLLSLRQEGAETASPFAEGAELNPHVQKILLYIHKNFREDITLSDIAAYSSFSPHYISQLFHTATASTLTQYITHLRLEYAKNLLFSTDFSVTEICYKSGFRSFAHFLRSFKKKYGHSPAKFRVSLREHKF